MTRDQVVQLLGWRLGDRDDMALRIELEMKLAQSTVLEVHAWLPWFLLKDWSGALTTAGAETVPLPADFLDEAEESHLYIKLGDQWKRLRKMDLDSARSYYTTNGVPQAYARLGERLYLAPIPDAAYELKMEYYGRDTDMTAANVETQWLRYASDLVIAVVGKELAEKHIQNPEQAAAFSADIELAWNRLYTQHVAMGEVNQSRSLGRDS